MQVAQSLAIGLLGISSLMTQKERAFTTNQANGPANQHAATLGQTCSLGAPTVT